MKVFSSSCCSRKSLGYLFLTIPEIFTKPHAEDTGRKSSLFKNSWSIRKLKILSRKINIFYPGNISSQWFRKYGAANLGEQMQDRTLIGSFGLEQ
jgi:hypothetical protein